MPEVTTLCVTREGRRREADDVYCGAAPALLRSASCGEAIRALYSLPPEPENPRTPTASLLLSSALQFTLSNLSVFPSASPACDYPPDDVLHPSARCVSRAGAMAGVPLAPPVVGRSGSRSLVFRGGSCRSWAGSLCPLHRCHTA